MFEGLVHRVLVGYLGSYVKNIQKDHLKLSLWNEEVFLENVELIPEAFDYLQLPFALKQGRIGKLSIKISWKKLGWDQPIIIALEDVFICASQRDDHEWSVEAAERREFAGKKAKLAAAELAKLSRRVCDNQAGKSFISYITAKVLDSIQLSIRNFHIQYNEIQLDSSQVLFGLKFSSLTIKQNLVGSLGGKVVRGQVNKTVDVEALEIYCTTSKGAVDSTSLDNTANFGYERSDGNTVDHLLQPFDVTVSLVVWTLPSMGPFLSKKAQWLASIMVALCTRIYPVRCPQEVEENLMEILRTATSIDEYILGELELMEKESDIDDILSYRAAAEHELQEVMSSSSSSNMGVNGANISVEKSRNDEQMSGRSRGWLNWLSRGMLGAGGTDDSSQFSGVVSDEVVKDIYEATEFHPSVLSGGDVNASGKMFTCAMKLSVGQIAATLHSKYSSERIADFFFRDAVIECKLWEELAAVICFIKSGKMVYPFNEMVILQIGRSLTEQEDRPTSCTVQVDVLPKQEVELSVKVMLQPLEVNCDVEFCLKLLEFFTALQCFEFQSKRVLWSLNGFKDAKTRLLSKAEYALSSHKKLSWEISILNIIINVPGRTAISEQCNLVLEMGSLLYASKYDVGSVTSTTQEQSNILKQFSSSTFTINFLRDFLVQDLYNYFAVELENFELKLVMPQHAQTVTILEQFCAVITFASCIISDESILKKLEVSIIVPSLIAEFSPPIYESIMALVVHLHMLHSTTRSLIPKNPFAVNAMSNQPWASIFGFSINAKLESLGFRVDLANDRESSSKLVLLLKELDIWYSHTEFDECFICTKALKVTTSPLRNENDGCTLFSSGNHFASGAAKHQDLHVGNSNQDGNPSDDNGLIEAFFLMHYEAHRSVDFVSHKFAIGLNDADLHCYPHIFGLLIGFYERLSTYGVSYAYEKSCSSGMDGKNTNKRPDFQFRRFGYSNFSEGGSSDHASISLDCYPFITISNSGSLGSLESSLHHSIPDWKKYFKLKDRKLRSPKCNMKKESRTFHASPVIHTSGMDTFPAPGSLCETNIFNFDINLCGVRVHFHDSSCVVGTVTIPNSKSSLLIYDNYMDLLCSIEGLILTSPWWTKNFKDFLWGPSLPNLSSILNLRVRKGHALSVTSQLEVSIGVQHVCCFLPPEYLAILIGYFLLSDWIPNLSEQPVAENRDSVATEKGSLVVYKFEILESTLILPVERDEHQYLKIELHQLYCSLILECSTNDVLKDIPPECKVLAHKVAKANHCLNIFGRDLILSLLLCKDDEYGCLILDEDTGCGNVVLIAPLSADVWVRLPCESESRLDRSFASTCVMSRIANCQLIADDCYTLDGFEALMDVINQFSSIDNESKCFTSDVLHFFQLKRSLKENGAVPTVASVTVFTEARLCTDSLSISLYQSRKDSFLSQPIAKTDMRFICSISLINETPIDLDMTFSSLALYSLRNSVMMAQCTDTCSASALQVCFSKSTKGDNEFQISLPSLAIWLHVSDWSAVIDLYNSFSKTMAETVAMEASSKSSSKDMADLTEYVALTAPHSYLLNKSSTSRVKEHIKRDLVALNVRSQSIGLTIHFPFWAMEAAHGELGTSEVQEERPQNVSSSVTEGKIYKFMILTTHSSSSELSMVGRNAKLKSILETTSGTVEICKDKGITTWPLFQISQISITTDICHNQLDPVNVKLGVQVNHLDVWLSHQVLCFWYGVRFDIPEAGTSQYSFASMDFNIQLRKVSLLISDERWSCGGPLLEILMRNILLHAIMTENDVESSVTSDLEVNYNNIHKVLWEPFIEPWKFQINMIRRHKMSTLLNSSIITDIYLTSTAPLNLNLTESLIECVFRTVEMVKDAWHLMEPSDPCEIQRFSSCQFPETLTGGKYAPYILQNLTSLPLAYHVFQGLVNVEEINFSEFGDGKAVEPGASVPIYLNESPEEQLFRFRPIKSSDRLSEKQSNGVVHHFMSIQLDGMHMPSAPISMDLVGLTCFEVDFSKASNKIEIEKFGDVSRYNINIGENVRSSTNNGFHVPVVFDVSVQRYSKLIRLYSTVILSNATSMTLELRFDIPFGLSPKILDPIYPGQEVPLPLHLAEAGRLRWRPLGNSYLWSEVHDLSNILSQEIKIGFLRSFVCYPSHPSSDPFRCCISVQNFCMPSSSKPKKGSSSNVNNTTNQSVQSCTYGWKQSKKQCIHQITLSTPLIVNSYLPDAVSLTIESGGVSRTALLSEVETSFHHVDPSHDLSLEFYVQGYRPSPLKFPRTETFSAMAKFSGTKFSLTETMIFNPELSNGPLYINVELIMDAFSGAREIFIFAPFLLYNCTGLPFHITESASEMKGNFYAIPSSYLIEQELLQEKKDGLSLLSSDQDSYATAPLIDGLGNSFMENHFIMAGMNANPHLRKFMYKPAVLRGSSFFRQSDNPDLVGKKSSSNMCSTSKPTPKDSDLVDAERGKVKACMYSPCFISSLGEVMVRIRRCLPEHVEKESNSSWSEPFLLLSPSRSRTVLVPHLSPNAAFIISVTSSALAEPFTGRTQAITFQPRYVISNACRRDLCYKQKGTDRFVHLGIGKHSHLHWTDTMRDLLVSIRFNEPGWQWSGSFLPDHLGDTQLKMRNFISGSLNMIRVEVQNADVSIRDEKIVGSLHGNSGTYLILLSDDDTGFMPYRIDNFTKERLRIYQQRCETFDTIVHPYTSCPYAWDEPCYPHRLTVEVPGERAIGVYALDELREYVPVHLKPTSEKPERTLLLSIHAEGAIKVFSIVDSGYHVLKDPSPSSFQVTSKYKQQEQNFGDYQEKFSLALSCIGISLVNGHPQELLFACAKDITLNLIQSVDQQRLSFQISTLQIDNQLRTTPYPVILSFNQEYRSNAASQRAKDDVAKLKSERVWQISTESYCEPVVYLAIATWRKKDISLVSFEYISLRVADFRLELDQELILNLLAFFKSLSSRFLGKALPISDDVCYSPMYDVGFAHTQTCEYVKTREEQLHGFSFPEFSKSIMSSSSLPSMVPIGAPWQQIYLLARRQKKIYVELFDLAPIKFTLSFSSAPWILRNGVLTSGESIIHRGLMALADVEGARIHLKQLTIAHQMTSWESMQDILLRHYTRQLLHEMYKVFGSAGVIGNPMGFARSLGLGIRDFLSVPARSVLQSPTGLITGMAQGTTSLLSNTVYALSDAATQFSKAAHKGIVAFTFDDLSVGTMEKQQKGVASHSKGVINEVLEGLTGLLQSPIKEAEKHGLPGVLSGIALGVTGLVARPAASILEVTGKTAQSIRSISKLHQSGSQRYRARLPRPLSREHPLRPYSLEEAVGTSVLMEADDGLKLKDEVFVMCKSLKQAGKFIVVTERLMLIVCSPSLVDLEKPEFRGVPIDPEWLVESEIGLDSVIHADTEEGVVHIVGSSSDARLRQNQHQSKKGGGTRTKHWSIPSTRLPLFQTNLELASKKDAEELLLMLLSVIEQGRVRGWGCGHLLHKSNIIWKEEHSYELLGGNQL
ncbi:uncharacterized protein LOC110642362 isoform X2 [Hevea brasiliensis]|uniref:uncharacterized protein LOC110642362 isoform X2 n=2 Tax=Hevea brasiliensis TaxID=3981 RepID=UPI0025DCE978|nr:uncharacterized protein LOC110642362 isoform X2 [Hevea brasiliensis]